MLWYAEDRDQKEEDSVLIFDYFIEYDQDDAIVRIEEDLYFIIGEINNFILDGEGFGLE